VKRADPLGTLDELQWWTFVCSGCGETTYVGQDLAQDVIDFAAMCRLLFGDPPVCSVCQHERRVA